MLARAEEEDRAVAFHEKSLTLLSAFDENEILAAAVERGSVAPLAVKSKTKDLVCSTVCTSETLFWS